jgi:hypothetical protein
LGVALWPEFDLTYKEIFYAGIWGSNVNFGIGPNGQDLANIEIDYYVGITPKVGKWNFDIATYYVTYPGAFDPGGEFDYVEIWTSVSRNLFNDKLELKLYNYWSPEYFGETGNNEVLEFNSEWTLNKVWYFTPKLSGKVGHQWGNLRVSRWLLPTLAAAYAYPTLGRMDDAHKIVKAILSLQPEFSIAEVASRLRGGKVAVPPGNKLHAARRPRPLPRRSRSFLRRYSRASSSVSRCMSWRATS